MRAEVSPKDCQNREVFDLINGLPLHPLVVHAAVVLIPLTLVGVILITVRRKWRKTLGWWVVLLALAATGFSVLAKESGEALAARVGLPEAHAEMGDIVPAFAGVTFLAVLLMVAVDRLMDRGDQERSPVLVVILGVVAIVCASAATVQVVRTGESGARSVWAEEVAATSAGGSAGQPVTPQEESGAAASSSASPSPSAAKSGGYSLADVQQHSSPSDCWAAIGGSVYDLSPWIDQHPGGAQAIIGLCGQDGTDAFAAQHGGQSEPAQELATFRIGSLS